MRGRPINRLLCESNLARVVIDGFCNTNVATQDEIDALASSRSTSDLGGGSHDGVLTSLLNEMDGVEELFGVTVVVATNQPDAIVRYEFPVSVLCSC